MESIIHRLSARLLPLSTSSAGPFVGAPGSGNAARRRLLWRCRRPDGKIISSFDVEGAPSSFLPAGVSGSRRQTRAAAGWFLGLGGKKGTALPEIIKAGDPVLHEPARDIVEDMIQVMRQAPGVGLSAPQIGVPLRIIVLEDTKEYISYADRKEVEAQDRRPFNLLVILNPILKKKGDRTALFFEGCLSVDGFRAVVERHLEVEVTGLDCEGRPIKVDAAGWQARILQHECDHLEGTIYVDRMLPRTFRTVGTWLYPSLRAAPSSDPLSSQSSVLVPDICVVA
ncbi:unnamed protein product [Spirodela intermedia]|uniref:Peptide deformylase n=1 Tax=Spirodela intermedia TaxID=51605 RepID=A0A7I8IS24_SPIIN|nr:unnamed protein product [Spirodela intermedia]CAA6660798.1 unnamed protein product [Spirodela intermedia]